MKLTRARIAYFALFVPVVGMMFTFQNFDQIDAPIQGFDETFYLKAYPDVAAAVQNGKMPSALYHYALSGCKEGRNPNNWFNETQYRRQNPTIKPALAGADYQGCAYKYYLEKRRSK